MFYTGYLLTQTSRKLILDAFVPTYPNVICHHITEQYDVPSDSPPPTIPSNVKVVGRVDSGDGVEALLISINGETIRPDGKSYYHITLSLAKDRKPVESNKYIKNATPVDPLTIMVIPKLFAGAT